jgi:benzylsuccinate CoA-transferase BbsF subunit
VPPDTAMSQPASPDPAGALAGLRVVDFGWVLAAPIGTRLLASFGAEVIRIESSGKPDSMRSQPGPDGKPHPHLGGLYNSVNAGKKSFTVDLTKPAGLALVKELIATADIVVNNFRPGVMERMGLGYDALRQLNSDVILLNLPGAHRNGPWARHPSTGNILMAASGFNMLTGFPGERPRGIGVAYPDFTSPHLLVATILAAVRQRRATGTGQELHLTQLSSMLSLLGCEWMAYRATGEQPPRNANRSPNHCPHGIFPATHAEDHLDAWVAIAVAGDAEWAALCQVLGQPALAADARFASHAARKANEDAVDALLRDWTRTRDKWAIADALQAAGIAAAPVEHLRDMLERDPQLPGHYQTVRQPEAPEADIVIDREGARWVGHELILRRAPLLGEHNGYVVQELLGRSDEAFARLVMDEVLS